MKIHLLFLVFLWPLFAAAQEDTAVYRLYKNRQALEYRLNKEVIIKNLSLPLHDSTEDKWADTFFAIEYLNRKDDWVEGRIRMAVTDIHKRSYEFTRALLELLYGQYPITFKNELTIYLPTVTDEKVWTMVAEYLLATATNKERKKLEKLGAKKLKESPNSPFFISFMQNFKMQNLNPVELKHFFSKNYLPESVLMISVQRKNRNYPGLVVVRDSLGNFLKDSSGKIFSVPQLARSLSGLPSYLTNGNTPAGILRMDGFDISKAGAIGPTQNVQLTLPLEFNARHFLRDSSIVDTLLKLNDYRNLLPGQLRNHENLYQAYYAGMAGRHEIIAHGTTVIPEYYAGKSYYPFTPTLGCLCTNETWNDSSGLRVTSDQQMLVNAIKKAGGPSGYAIVIDLDDKKEPVSLYEVLSLIRKAGNE